ncbi:hypothetical protein C1H46_007554 [Malus baccata]|uniref:Uncharacterized protein n=1 Tax=Malus baccata TaxID=106549 RepID=A0A540N712_MALBA|nr:hypothetical protein C1H46_007554 [Malus baccata]
MEGHQTIVRFFLDDQFHCAQGLHYGAIDYVEGSSPIVDIIEEVNYALRVTRQGSSQQFKLKLLWRFFTDVGIITRPHLIHEESIIVERDVALLLGDYLGKVSMEVK